MTSRRNKYLALLIVVIGISLHAIFVYPFLEKLSDYMFSNNMDLANLIKIVFHTIILVSWLLLAIHISNR